MPPFPYLKPFVIVDVETTGGSAQSNRLIEIGMIRVENGREVSRFQSLVNPGQSVPIFVQRLTGISDQDLVSAPAFSEIAEQVEKELQNALFVGHNVRFDYDFVRHEFRRLEKRFVAPTLCSARLSRALFPEYKRHNLSELIARHGLEVSSRHRALDDAQAVWDFFQKTAERVGADKFLDVFEKLVAGRPVHSRIPVSRFKNIPETAGVYVFRDEKGEALYIGKSANLRERILGHFYGDFENERDAAVLELACDMEWFRAPGELSALFLEAELNEKWRPRFARKIKSQGGMVCAVLRETASDFPWVDLFSEREVRDKSAVLGFYRGFREAKQTLLEIAEKFCVCRKMLGLEQGSGACSGVGRGRCDGACQKSELREKHREQMMRGFRQAGSVSWPYPGAILIEERESDEADQGEAYLVHNWLLIARIRYQDGAHQIYKMEQGFDRDQFKVLKKIIQSEFSRIQVLKKPATEALLREAILS